MRTKEMRIATLTLIAMFVATMVIVPAAVGQKNDFSTEKEYGELFLENMDQSKKLIKPIPLNNMNGDLEAVSFSMKNGGYIIINVNDLSVPEFSLEGNSPFSDRTKTYVYNGPLAYMEDKQGALFQIGMRNAADEAVTPEYVYTVASADKDKKLADLKALNNRMNTRSIGSGSLDDSLRTWEDDNILCGPIAAGITLMYFDDQHDDDFVDSTNEYQGGLLDLIINGGYIPNQDTDTSTVKNGLNDYLEDRNLDDDYSTDSRYSFSFNELKSLINSDKPVIVDTDNHPTYGEHWIIAHGYVELINYKYMIINNGWGGNNINVAVDDYIDDMVYID
ncbi:C39 family peptidase [Methanohalophilus sp.]